MHAGLGPLTDHLPNFDNFFSTHIKAIRQTQGLGSIRTLIQLQTQSLEHQNGCQLITEEREGPYLID
jgi:hypothetical protein